MRVFYLYRTKDVSGVSGTGWVAEGAVLESGKCVVSWLTENPSVTVHDSYQAMERVHCHRGATQTIWNDLDWVDKDGYPIAWAGEGFYYLRPDGGGPEWPNEKSFKASAPVRPVDWFKAKAQNKKSVDPLAWEKMCQQFDQAVDSMHEAAASVGNSITMTQQIREK